MAILRRMVAIRGRYRSLAMDLSLLFFLLALVAVGNRSIYIANEQAERRSTGTRNETGRRTPMDPELLSMFNIFDSVFTRETASATVIL
ncbi:hypothetical protein HPP92_001390 [Vanilla planifolia]|uniref:Uncharacterized protein n=1 Tax=Vanilla planifolia TaxID=51239 RepID=A0A835SCL9_VANPL|nr:hypothetical protein HPP92_001390 [Vanilla planifolia]